MSAPPAKSRCSLQVRRDIDQKRFVGLGFGHAPIVGFQEFPELMRQILTREFGELLDVLADERFDRLDGNAAGRYRIGVLPRSYQLFLGDKQKYTQSPIDILSAPFKDARHWGDRDMESRAAYYEISRVPYLFIGRAERPILDG
jgi:hypothetical protein